jgi:hypothetical protein
MSDALDLPPEIIGVDGRVDPVRLADWLVKAVREAVEPLRDLTDQELEDIADELVISPSHRAWLTPPMARLQLRLRVILADYEAGE